MRRVGAGPSTNAGRMLLAGVAALALALALTVPGCSGGDDDDGPTGPTGPPDRVVLIIPNPSTIAADGSEVSELIINVMSLTGGPLDGAVVQLETDLGVFDETGTRDQQVSTDSHGLAFSGLRGDGQAGSATVTARSGGFTISVEIVLA